MLSLSERSFSVIAGILRTEAGIHLARSKAAMIEARMRRRMRDLRIVGDYDAYCALLDGPGGATERRRLVSALTTNVTGFFREPHHFALLAEEAAARLTAGTCETLAIWSAGCSDGSEAVSALLAIARACPDLDPARVAVTATDIDDEAVAAAAAGSYPVAALGTAAATYADWLEDAGGDQFRLAPAWRARLTARRHNLVGRPQIEATFDVVMCRNVLIYFDEVAKADAQNTLIDALRPGGLLMLGHSERLTDPRSDLVRVGITAFRRTPIGGLT